MTLPVPDRPYALVVDDDLIIRMDAMSKVAVLFTDVQMPGMLDGFALARKVAASWPHISIVVASGHVRPEPGCMPDKARFIAKPFSAELVHAHLQELLADGEKPLPLRQKMGASPSH